MTAKEKAKELVDKYYIFNHIGNKHAVKCALIAVDEILIFIDKQMQGWLDADIVSYWQEVKQEIEKL